MTTLRVRLLDGATVIAERDFTAVGRGGPLLEEAAGSADHKLTSAADTETVNRLVRFVFTGRRGKGLIFLDGMTLPPLAEDFGMGCAVEQVGLTEA